MAIQIPARESGIQQIYAMGIHTAAVTRKCTIPCRRNPQRSISKISAAQAKADVEKINADAEAYSIKTRAEAEADANDKIAKSLTEALIRYTEAQRWNGELPGTFLGSSDALPVINVDGNGGN